MTDRRKLSLDEVVRITTYSAHAQILRGLAALMRGGTKVTPEMLEEVASNLEAKAKE